MERPSTSYLGNMAKVIGFKKNINYVERRAVRTIVTNEQDEIVLLFTQNGNYCKLPGGGIEADEDHLVAVEREAMEATGCKVMMDGECIATTEEWRKGLRQISYCYRGRLVENTGIPELTEDEVLEGLKHEWISFDGALEKMKASQPTSELGRFIKERDLYFLETYARSMGSS